jgi:hypothetical protein
MTYKLRAGAPFDSNNIFNVPPIDPGPFSNPYSNTVVSKIDGGSFQQPPTHYFNGGTIPAAGTATYDPTRTYGPNDIIT